MRTPWKVVAVALVALAGCYMLLPGSSEAGQPGQYKTAYGVAVYLGVKPAREIKAQPQTYPGLHARHSSTFGIPVRSVDGPAT